ncbi:MAG TPA: tripartite tricarboxylate transporter substrate binding protein [Burkholderiales bacterium]|nr:tripartite tricarboxylate transporter substrate binding protein [Burkholderiales bacterium]
MLTPNVRSRLLALALCLSYAAIVSAQEFPRKSIRIIVPYPPGSSGDVMMRLLSQRLSDAFRQPVIIDNRAGGGGIVGAELVAKAAADGYTLFFTAINHVTNVALYSKLPFDAQRDFAAVSLVADVPVILVAHPATGFKTTKDLIDAAKAKPRQLNFGSAGGGTGGHLAMEMFMRAAGINLTHVPYKGATPALTDVVAGQVQVLFTGVPPTLPFIKEGRLNPLVISGAKRSPTLPNTPSMQDIGMLKSDVQVWFGLVTRAGVPKPIVRQISTEVARLMREPEMMAKFAAQGIDPVGSTPEEFEQTIRRDFERLPRLIRESGIKAE